MGRLVPRGSQYSKPLESSLGTVGQVPLCSIFLSFILLTIGNFTERASKNSSTQMSPFVWGRAVSHHEKKSRPQKAKSKKQGGQRVMSSKTTLQIFEDTILIHARYLFHRTNIPNAFYRRKSISDGFGSGIKLSVNPWIPNFLAA